MQLEDSKGAGKLFFQAKSDRTYMEYMEYISVHWQQLANLIMCYWRLFSLVINRPGVAGAVQQTAL